jgi:hypothetical protein
VNRTRDAHARIKAEIAPAKAAALGRVGAISRRLDTTADPEERARLLGEYEEARTRALHTRLALVIQREANGLRHQRVVDQQFPVPPRRADGPGPGAP